MYTKCLRMNTQQRVDFTHHMKRITRWLGWRGLRDNGLKPLPFWNESHTFCFFVPEPLFPLPCSCPKWPTPPEPSFPLTCLMCSLCLRLDCSYHTLLHFPRLVSLAPSLLPLLLFKSICSSLASHNQYDSTRIAQDFPP